MTTRVQRRRGTAAEHAAFTGAAGEITVDTTNNRAIVHDGVTAGGHAVAKYAEVVLTASLAAGVAAWFASPTSVNLKTAITDETGSGALVFATSPALVTPLLGTPTSGVLTNCTGLPVGSGISGFGTGIAAFLATPSSANLKAALTDETGSGAAVFADSPTLVTPTLGAATATSISVGGNQVVGARITGWGVPSGTLDRTALAAYAGQTVSAGYVQAEAQATDDAVKKVSQELAALITDLRTHGLIGT